MVLLLLKPPVSHRELLLVLLPFVVAWGAMVVESYRESPLGPGPDGPWATATAEVLQVERVTLSYMSSERYVTENPEPYDLARVRFVPAGRGAPVQAAYPETAQNRGRLMTR